MELTRDEMDPAKDHLGDSVSYAPLEVFATMLHLQEPAAVVASVCESKSVEGSTTWRAVWLTDSRLVYCDASADISDWDFSDRPPPGHSEGASINAWAVPLSEVCAVGVVAARAAQEFSGWAADVEAVVEVRGREGVTVPLFGGFATSRLRASCEQFLREIVSRMP